MRSTTITIRLMTQILTIQPTTPVAPVCEQCGGPTRLAGLEPHPTDDSADLLTHVCIQCDWTQTTTLVRRHNGE